LVVKSLIRGSRIKVSPDTTVDKVWKLLARRDITLVPVVDEKNTLVGVIGEDDILYLLVPDYREYFSEFFPISPDLEDLEEKLEKELILKASDVMNREVVYIHEDQPVFKALSRMMIHRIRALPVLDTEEKYAGIIYEDDIMQYLFDKHKHLVKKRK